LIKFVSAFVVIYSYFSVFQVSAPSPQKNEKSGKKSAATRREELLKQLKAVEDAIAKKRSKLPT
jgi:hypothetical protein